MEQGSNFFNNLINGIKNIFGSAENGTSPQGGKVSFSSSGRSGYVLYESPEGKLNLYYEFGGGDAIAIIDIPTEEKWAAATTIPPEQRMEVLHFIGKTAVQKQTLNGAYEIQDKWILIR